MIANELIIGEKKIGGKHPCFVIAEIGQNHQGDINIAKNLITIAKKSGADCVKFQKSCLSEKFTKKVLKSDYNSKNSWGKTYGEHKEFLEFSNEEFVELQKFATDLSILLTASAMDEVSLKFLASVNVPFIKIGSGDSDNLLLIEEAAKTKIPLIISTGMQDEKGVKQVFATVKRIHDNFALLHCVSSYPTPNNQANLKAIISMKHNFPQINIGYSGHEIGYNLTLASVALGAKIVERHITLDRTWKGSDHCCSLEPIQLSEMIKAIREIEISLGDGVKRLMESEKECKNKLGKCVVARNDLKAGVTLNRQNITVKVAREIDGLAPSSVLSLVGKKTTKSINKDQPITIQDFI